ncbi:MAG: TRAP transporter substrate-binding protein DctP [Tistlia sp.]|uniref:TRAP transporter substrate-binding protein DctP n=1 Tax=Tistlia sp. TaxID=3057121 RepID=UPI0034A498AA
MTRLHEQRGRRLAAVTTLTGALALGAAFAGAAQAEEIDMRLGLIYNPNVPVARCGALVMAEDPALKELGLNITVIHSAQLGGENDMAQQVSSGELEMSVSASSILAAWVEDLSVFETYYLYDNVDQAFAAYETETAKVLFEELREVANIQVIGTPWLYGERHIFGGKALRTPADFEGVKMRVPETSVSIAGAQSLGASPTPTAYAELYLALQQGIVDVAEAPASVVKAESFDEPAKFFNKTSHLISAAPTYINGPLYDSLTGEQQAALGKAVDEAAQRIRDCVETADAEAFKGWQESGDLEIVDDVDLDALRAKSRAFFSEGFPWSDTYKALLAELGQ